MRLIDDPPRHGGWNMAVDEALLDSAAAEGIATLRFYQWSEPTLSLGYFQPYADRRRHEASIELPCVRRRSGGGAIVHDLELTYSLAAPTSALPAGGAAALYRLAHESLIEAIAEGAPEEAVGKLRLCEQGIPGAISGEPFLCFQRRGEGDLLFGGARGDEKVAGSAQRKSRGAVLQHGSVILGKSTAATELPGLAEMLGTAPGDAAELARRWAPGFAARLGVELLPAQITEKESLAAQTILSQRFDSESWNKRR